MDFKLVYGVSLTAATLEMETNKTEGCKLLLHALQVFVVNNEELRDLYFSPSKIRIIKSRKVRWAGHVARIGTRIDYWWESQRERDR
jgi:hypothetical protein